MARFIPLRCNAVRQSSTALMTQVSPCLLVSRAFASIAGTAQAVSLVPHERPYTSPIEEKLSQAMTCLQDQKWDDYTKAHVHLLAEGKAQVSAANSARSEMHKGVARIQNLLGEMQSNLRRHQSAVNDNDLIFFVRFFTLGCRPTLRPVSDDFYKIVDECKQLLNSYDQLTDCNVRLEAAHDEVQIQVNSIRQGEQLMLMTLNNVQGSLPYIQGAINEELEKRKAEGKLEARAESHALEHQLKILQEDAIKERRRYHDEIDTLDRKLRHAEEDRCLHKGNTSRSFAKGVSVGFLIFFPLHALLFVYLYPTSPTDPSSGAQELEAADGGLGPWLKHKSLQILVLFLTKYSRVIATV